MNKWILSEESKKRIPKWNAETIRIIEATNDYEINDEITIALKKIYRAANLSDEINIVKVPSVFVGIAVNVAANYYWEIVNSTTALNEDPIVDSYIYSDTNSATGSDIDSITRSATDLATRSATRSATDLATRSTTGSDIDLITHSATCSATEILLNLLKISNSVICEKLKLDEQKTYLTLKNRLNDFYDFYNGGCEWASWVRYLAFVRDVCGFNHPSHENFAYYEQLTNYGPRFMHKNYVIMCGKIESKFKNAENLLHKEDGPAITWRCGTKNWYINGTLCDQQIVEFPHTLTVEQINKEQNADKQRVMLERKGVVEYIKESKAIPLDKRHDFVSNKMEQLYEINGNKKLLAVDPSGEGIVILSVPNTVKTCEEAQKWLSPFGGNVILAT